MFSIIVFSIYSNVSEFEIRIQWSELWKNHQEYSAYHVRASTVELLIFLESESFHLMSCTTKAEGNYNVATCKVQNELIFG